MVRKGGTDEAADHDIIETRLNNEPRTKDIMTDIPDVDGDDGSKVSEMVDEMDSHDEVNEAAVVNEDLAEDGEKTDEEEEFAGQRTFIVGIGGMNRGESLVTPDGDSKGRVSRRTVSKWFTNATITANSRHATVSTARIGDRMVITSDIAAVASDMETSDVNYEFDQYDDDS